MYGSEVFGDIKCIFVGTLFETMRVSSRFGNIKSISANILFGTTGISGGSESTKSYTRTLLRVIGKSKYLFKSLLRVIRELESSIKSKNPEIAHY